MHKRLACLGLLLICSLQISAQQSVVVSSNITRTTLSNGLQVVRQVSGYVYTVDVNLAASRTRATYSVTYACDPANSSKAAAPIARDLTDMQTSNVTTGELQQAKALLLRQLTLRESSEDSVAGGLLARAQIELPLDEAVRGAHRYFDLTAEEIRTAFQKWIRPDGFVQVVTGPTPK
jgi:zinc protease